jgi:hypothetical protein
LQEVTGLPQWNHQQHRLRSLDGISITVPRKRSNKKEMGCLQATFEGEVDGTDGSCVGEAVVVTGVVLVVNVSEVIVLSGLTNVEAEVEVELTVEELAPGTT